MIDPALYAAKQAEIAAIFSEEQKQSLQQMPPGATLLLCAASDKYPGGAALIIVSRYGDGFSFAQHEFTRERGEELRDNLALLFPAGQLRAS